MSGALGPPVSSKELLYPPAKDRSTAIRRIGMKQRAASSGVGQLIQSGRAIPDIRGVLDLDLLDPQSQARATAHWEALHRHDPRLPKVGRLVLVRAKDEGWRPRPPALGRPKE